MTLQGTRVTNGDPPDGWDRPGAYGQVGDEWLGVLPTGELCVLNRAHTVVEHEDGTITVSPSILMSAERSTVGQAWHGWLERGVWCEV